MSSDESEAPGEANMWHWLVALANSHEQSGALSKIGVGVCCPTVCEMHVCNNGGTDAEGVSREVHVCFGESDVEEACRFLRRGVSSPKTLMDALAAEDEP